MLLWATASKNAAVCTIKFVILLYLMDIFLSFFLNPGNLLCFLNFVSIFKQCKKAIASKLPFTAMSIGANNMNCVSSRPVKSYHTHGTTWIHYFFYVNFYHYGHSSNSHNLKIECAAGVGCKSVCENFDDLCNRY